MIRISELNNNDIGRYVKYKTKYKNETGRIKSWNNKYIFVVYHCNKDWDDYQNYTAAATDPVDLCFL